MIAHDPLHGSGRAGFPHLGADPTGRARSSALGASCRHGVRDVPFGQSSSLLPLRIRLPGCVRGLLRYYRAVRLPRSVRHRRTSLDFPMPPKATATLGKLGTPGSRARCLRTCSGSQTARDSGTPRDSGAPDGAFRLILQRRRPGESILRGPIPGPHVPLSTLRRRPCERLRRTRGRCGSLNHFRMTFAFTTPRRF
jgi:hypothetical protein